MAFPTRARLLVGIPIGCALAVVSSHSAIAGQGTGPPNTSSDHPAAQSQLAMTTSTTVRPASIGGNLSVYVPEVPSQRSLPGLCRAFLNSDMAGKNGQAFEVLVGATGGSVATTSAWCGTYLTIWHQGGARAN